MKTSILAVGLIALVSPLAVQAQKNGAQPAAPAMAAPSPAVYQAPPPAPAEPQANNYEQKLYGGQPARIIPADQTQSIIDRFTAAYPKMGSPRFLIFVNRELVDQQSGMQLVGRDEITGAGRSGTTSKNEADPNARASGGSNTVSITSGGSVVVAGDINNDASRTPGRSETTAHQEVVVNENTYRIQDRTTLSVAERQALRDVEISFGRQLRAGGASLADQHIAGQLIGDQPLQNFTAQTEGEAARKDREAIGKIADVVVEVLLTYHAVTITNISENQIITSPEIYATAIQLKDSKILGEVGSDELTSRLRGAELTRFSERDIAEATALALMDDIAK